MCTANERDVSRLEEENSQLQDKISDTTMSLNRQINSEKDRADAAERAVEKNKEEIQRLESALEDNRDTISTMKAEISTLDLKHMSTEKDFDVKHRQEKFGLKKEIDSLKEALSQAKADVEKQRVESRNNEIEVRTLQDTLSQLQTKHTDQIKESEKSAQNLRENALHKIQEQHDIAFNELRQKYMQEVAEMEKVHSELVRKNTTFMAQEEQKTKDMQALNQALKDADEWIKSRDLEIKDQTEKIEELTNKLREQSQKVETN